MSTRGNIAIKENGKYNYIYNHSDSSIDRLGITLFHHYNTAEKAKELIALGHTCSIGNTPDNTAQSYIEHTNRPLEERGTVAGYRESRRWKEYFDSELSKEECEAVETAELNDICEQEYTYLFDTLNSKWYIAYKYDGYKFRELEKVLHSKELLQELFSDNYKEEYLTEFYSLCLSA